MTGIHNRLSTILNALFDVVERRRWMFLFGIGFLLLGSLLVTTRLEFDNQIETVLPGNPEVLRNIRFLRESNLSDTIMVSLRLDSDTHSLQDLIPVADSFCESLGPPMIERVVRGMPEGDLMRDMMAFSDFAPQVVGQKVLDEVDAQLNEEAIRARLREHFKQLMGPSSAFSAPLIQSDPMGIKTSMLKSLEVMADARDGQFGFEGGHLVSPDERQVLLMLHTPVAVTDGARARELVDYLNLKAGTLPDFVTADMVAAHFHAVSNEEVIRRDIAFTLSIAALGFLILFLAVFRDLRAVLIFLIPVSAVIISVPFSALVMGSLSYFMIGMGAVIAGIAIDYGIHVYVAVLRHKGDSRATGLVVKPIVIGALTTVGVFAAFFFSNVEGYHQLAFFAISSILICLVLALGLFPHFLKGAKGSFWHGDESVMRNNIFLRRDMVVISAWLAILIWGTFQAAKIGFDSDIRQFDGSQREIIEAEDRFNETWGQGSQMGVLVAEGASLDAAQETMEHILDQVRPQVDISSFTDIWPSERVRRENASRWAAFWRDGREEKLRKLLISVGEEFHFSVTAFDPFFDTLYAHLDVAKTPEDLPIFQRIQQRYVGKRQDGYRVFSFFQDEREELETLTNVCVVEGDAFCVSRKALALSLNQAITSEIGLLATIAAILIPLLTFLLLRKPRLSILALVPVITSLIVVLAVLYVFSLSLNAPSIIAAMVVVGLSIDYGIFMVYACHFQLDTGTPKAVSLSAWTTLIGAGVLVFAQHPLLFFIGVTLVSGVGSGYLTANLVIPPLYRLTKRIGKES